MHLCFFIHRFAFPQSCAALTSAVVNSSISVYQEATKNLLPTPTKSHYLFNLRDVSRVIQGVCLSHPDTAGEPSVLKRLWIHEVTRSTNKHLQILRGTADSSKAPLTLFGFTVKLVSLS